MSDLEDYEILRSLRILVLEDHLPTHDALIRYLEFAGHKTNSAFTVAEARLALEITPYDVFISDIHLPDGTGWELLQTVNLRHPVYAIATSGYGEPEHCAKSKAAGFRHHLVKPCKISEWDGALRAAAGDWRMDN